MNLSIIIIFLIIVIDMEIYYYKTNNINHYVLGDFLAVCDGTLFHGLSIFCAITGVSFIGKELGEEVYQLF